MAGVKGRSGGARPGAGRKSRDTLYRQQFNRSRLLATVTDEDIDQMAGALISFAKSGNVRAFLALAPYLFGSPEAKIDVSGGLTVRVVYDDPDPIADA